MKQEIPIFFTIDDEYAPFLSCAINSIIDNASKDYIYKFIILHEKLSKVNIEKLSRLKKPGFEVEFHEMKEGLEKITDRDENKLNCKYFTLTIYFRLLIAEMFPEYNKGIYLDSDIIVLGDISKLYNIELDNNLIAACPDYSIQEIPILTKYLREAIGVKEKEYINSGVLLMNLKELRNNNFFSHFLNLLDTYHFDSVAPDQDYINAICNGKIYYLDEKWDAMPNNNKKPLKNPSIIHYNLFQKPWCYDNIQYEDYFWKYAKKSEFYEQILKYKEEFSDKKKSADEQSFKRLIKKADTISGTQNTFRNRYENGEKIRI